MTVKEFKENSIGIFEIEYYYQDKRHLEDKGQFDNYKITYLDFDYWGGYGVCVTLWVDDLT